MHIVDNRLTDYVIVIAEGATEAQRYAATELAGYTARITGAVLPVVSDAMDAQEKEIVIGRTNRPGTPCGDGLKNDGYILKAEGNRLFILGENDRGTLYGVYGLLEDYLGCRFLTPEVEKIPRRADLILPELDVMRIPPLEYRETFWHGPETNPLFAVKRGLNGSIFNNYPEKVGGGIQYYYFGHSFFEHVSPEEYFDEHPEYFSMVDGKRIREQTQLCLTNPDVLEITKKKLRQNIIDHPEAKIFSIAQMDWYNPCQCPECARVDAEEGAHSGTLIRFINACAASIAEEFPDVVIDTFAYQYTRQAPKTHPLPNVCVRICSIECCFTHPLGECNETASFKDRTVAGATFQADMDNWKAISPRMFVWDYTTNYKHYLAPFPNFHVLKDNVRYFVDHHVTGLFEQGNAETASGEFGELRAYVISKLMWNLDLDVEQAMEEFMTGYYGMAAAPLARYIRLLRDSMLERGLHVGIYHNPDQYIPDELIPQMDALFDEAEALADDAEVLDRVRKSRLQVRYVKLHRMPKDTPDRDALIDAFEADVRRYGIEKIREGMSLEQSIRRMRNGTLNVRQHDPELD